MRRNDIFKAIGSGLAAGECINFISRTHDGKPMSDDEYQSLKDIFKPHID